VSSIYLCIAIYLFYLLLEVVKLIRITILNYQRNVSITLRDSKIVLQIWTVTGLESDGRGEVVYRRTSVYNNEIWNNVRMIRMRTK
jgi:hypothetical protein